MWNQGGREENSRAREQEWPHVTEGNSSKNSKIKIERRKRKSWGKIKTKKKIVGGKNIKKNEVVVI